jgi:hypothetical protein
MAFLGVPTAVIAQEDHDHDAMTVGGISPQLTLHGFSDIIFGLQRDRFADGSESISDGFALGQFDLYFVSRLTPSLSFLGESVFETNEAGEGVVDVERMFIKYSWSDLFQVAVGRTHTALGYWNEAFHHGALLQPTVERPASLEFEDDGGILPVHSVGIELSGSARSPSGGISYVANVANGRGPIPDAVQNGGDLNRDKALGFKVTLALEGDQVLEIGPAFYRDLIPPDPLTPGREGEISEQIPGAHLHWKGLGLEVLTEAYRVRHEDRATTTVWNHDAWYAVAIRKGGRLRPYGAFDRIDFADGDPFYAPNDRDLSRAIGGLRFDFDPFNAVKLEYRHDWRPEQEESDAFLVQTAFTF